MGVYSGPTIEYGIRCVLKRGTEPPPLTGHLDDGEPIVKPTFMRSVYILLKEGLMKVIMRTPVKVVPGKMKEYMELEKERVAASRRIGMPPEKRYIMVSGPGDRVNTIFYEIEWDSLADIETFFGKMFSDSEVKAMQAKYDGLIESHGLELYAPMQ